MRPRAGAAAVRRSKPATRNVPAVGGSRPHSMRKVVDLPAPLAPSRPKISPRATVKLTSSTATNAPKRRVRCSTVITASAGREPACDRRARGCRRSRSGTWRRVPIRCGNRRRAPAAVQRSYPRSAAAPASTSGPAHPRAARPDRAASAVAVTTRTRLPWITASITPGSAASRACRRRRPETGGGGEAAARHLGGERTRRAAAQQAALVQQQHRVAALRLVQIGGAEQHRRPAPRAVRWSMICHSSRRDTGSTPTVGSSSSSSSGGCTRVQARPSFCFIPPDSRPARRAVNGPSPVMCSSSA